MPTIEDLQAKIDTHQHQISELRADVRVSEANNRVLEAQFATYRSETDHHLTRYKNWILASSGGVLLVIFVTGIARFLELF